MRYPKPHIKPEESFPAIRHAVFMNFIKQNAPIKEEDLTVEDILALISNVGENYSKTNRRIKND